MRGHVEKVQMRGHNIVFYAEITKYSILSSTPFYLELCQIFNLWGCYMQPLGASRYDNLELDQNNKISQPLLAGL